MIGVIQIIYTALEFLRIIVMSKEGMSDRDRIREFLGFCFSVLCATSFVNAFLVNKTLLARKYVITCYCLWSISNLVNASFAVQNLTSPEFLDRMERRFGGNKICGQDPDQHPSLLAVHCDKAEGNLKLIMQVCALVLMGIFITFGLWFIYTLKRWHDELKRYIAEHKQHAAVTTVDTERSLELSTSQNN